MTSLASFAACAFFLSLAYRFYFPCLSGMGIALLAVSRYELGLHDQRTAAAARVKAAR